MRDIQKARARHQLEDQIGTLEDQIQNSDQILNEKQKNLEAARQVVAVRERDHNAAVCSCHTVLMVNINSLYFVYVGSSSNHLQI